jgi:tRNA pseudouridine38-40 synthase
MFPMRNIRIVLEYDGTDFAGWQRQPPPARSVQGVLEEAIAGMTGEQPLVRGAGRTDAGVHARAQVASFLTPSSIPLVGFVRGLNASLPRDVAVVEGEEAPEDFEPRRAARGKHYAYRLWNRPSRSPLHERTSWHVIKPLDLGAMGRAAALLLGEHDFSSFRAAGCDARHPVRHLRRAEVSREGDLVTLDLEATAFLRGMARIIAGTLVEIGLGVREAATMADLLAARDRGRAGRTAPAHGLTLERVLYSV